MRRVLQETPSKPRLTFESLIGESPAMREVIQRLGRIASRETTLLLEGDSGTGKELAAQAVHAASPRHRRPFVVIDCRTSPGAIMVELNQRSAVNGGTLFFDEVSELDRVLQPRLLHLLENRDTPRRRPLDVRIIAATSRDLCREVALGNFRIDLYYRLAVNCVRLPPLSERREDIPLLWRHFSRQLADSQSVEDLLDEAVIRRLALRPWPGNVRELRNHVERAVTLGAAALELPLPPDPAEQAVSPVQSFHVAKAEVLASFERRYLTDVLARHQGNITAAASAAGVDRVHFLRLLDRHGLRRRRD